MNNIIIASGDLISGVTSWAFRIRDAFRNHPDIRIVVVNCLNETQSTGLFDFIANSEESFRQLVQQFENPIIIPNYFWNLFSICEQLRKEGKSLKIIGYCRSDSEDEYYLPLQKIENCLDHIVTVSPKCTERVRNYLPSFNRNNISTIPTGINVPRKLPTKPNLDKIQIAYGGRFENLQKRFFDLLPLIGELRALDTPFHLNIAGAGRLINEFEAQLTELGYSKNVSIIGKLHPSQMADFWAANHIMISLSDYEGTSNSMLEAMANGCVPVVSKTESGLETLENGKNGFLFPIGDSKKAAKKIESLAKNPEKLEMISRCAMKSIHQFSIDLHVKKFSKMIYNLG